MEHYRRSGTVILLMPVAAPVWGVGLGASGLTVGRALILLGAVLLALDWCLAPSEGRRGLPRAAWLLIAGIAGLWFWTAVNAETWGCGTCGGDLYGGTELAAVSVLAVVICTLEPKLRFALVLAVLVGGTVEAVLALAGVHGFTSGTMDTSSTQGRLAGTFGNPNELGIALAFSVPAALAALPAVRRQRRMVIVAALLVIGVALVLTLSRSALIAAAAGGALVLVLLQPPRSVRRRGLLAFLAVAAAAIGIGYPIFASLREHAENPRIDPALRFRDRSGWDATRLGMVQLGGATLSNPASGELEVRTLQARQGVSHQIIDAAARSTNRVTFEARALGAAAPLGFGLQDQNRLNGPVSKQAVVGPSWRRLQVRWRPTGRSPYARVYIFSAGPSSGFVLRDITSFSRPPGRGTGTTRWVLDTRLLGSVYAQLDAARRQQQQRYIDSRLFAAKTSLSAFATQPLRGIGWGRFTDYSAAHGTYGRLPTHDEYLRVLAELGAVGALLLAWIGVVVGWALRRARVDALGIAVLGLLTTGVIALVFINGLISPDVMLPLAFAAAIACARAAAPEPAAAGEPVRSRPVYDGGDGSTDRSHVTDRVRAAVQAPLHWRPAWRARSAWRALRQAAPRPRQATAPLAFRRASAPAIRALAPIPAPAPALHPPPVADAAPSARGVSAPRLLTKPAAALAPAATRARRVRRRSRLSAGPPGAASAPPSGYRPALDGLRAVAVLAVIGYHMTTRVPGGFLGVDVFFVLSGYLITSILLREQLTAGRIRLADFWARRARRLLPAVALLVLVCAIQVNGHADISTWSLRRSDLLSTLFYYANWHFIATDQSYFAGFLGASPVRHTWTLAIEEQFYVVWPLLVLGTFWLARRLNVRGPRLLAAVVVVGTAASAIAMALLYSVSNPSRAYFGTDTRVSSLLIGAGLALLVLRRPAWLTSRSGLAFARRAALPTTLVVLGFFALLGDGSSSYYDGGALIFCATIAVAIFVVEAAPQGPMARVLSIRPVRWTGRISYGLYLWYWPVLVWSSHWLPDDGRLRKLLQLAVIFAAATVSYYAVEAPIRYGRLPGLRLSRRRLAVVMPIVMAVVALTTVQLTAPDSGPLAAQLAPVAPLPCPAQVVVSGPYAWCPRVIGRPGAPVVASIGDSTSQSLYPGMRDAARRRGWTYIEAAEGGCSIVPLLLVEFDTPQDVAKARHCNTIMSQILAGVQARYRPSVWVLSDRWLMATLVTSDGTALSPIDRRRDLLIEPALRSRLRQLTADGARVLLIQMPPQGEPVGCALHTPAPPSCESQAFTVDDPSTDELHDIVRAAAHGLHRVRLVNVDNVVCPDHGACPGVIRGTVVRYDGIHYSGAYSRLLVPIILRRAEKHGLSFAPIGR